MVDGLRSSGESETPAGPVAYLGLIPSLPLAAHGHIGPKPGKHGQLPFMIELFGCEANFLPGL